METKKTIDLSKSVYTLSTQFPEFADIMASLGFEDIVKPGMLQTAGRFMTIPKGAAMKNIDIRTIKEAFAKMGFDVEAGT